MASLVRSRPVRPCYRTRAFSAGEPGAFFQLRSVVCPLSNADNEPDRRLHAERGLTMEDALILLTYLGELSLPLVGRWGQMVVHVCSSFPKEEMAAALENYRGGSRSGTTCFLRRKFCLAGFRNGGAVCQDVMARRPQAASQVWLCKPIDVCL